MVTIEELETRVEALERLMHELKLDKIAKVMSESGTKKSKTTRKKREYTEAEKAAIRERLFKGQEAARKKREVEAKVTKAKDTAGKDVKH